MYQQNDYVKYKGAIFQIIMIGSGIEHGSVIIRCITTDIPSMLVKMVLLKTLTKAEKLLYTKQGNFGFIFDKG